MDGMKPTRRAFLAASAGLAMTGPLAQDKPIVTPVQPVSEPPAHLIEANPVKVTWLDFQRSCPLADLLSLYTRGLERHGLSPKTEFSNDFVFSMSLATYKLLKQSRNQQDIYGRRSTAPPTMAICQVNQLLIGEDVPQIELVEPDPFREGHVSLRDKKTSRLLEYCDVAFCTEQNGISWDNYEESRPLADLQVMWKLWKRCYSQENSKHCVIRIDRKLFDQIRNNRCTVDLFGRLRMSNRGNSQEEIAAELAELQMPMLFIVDDSPAILV